jgi:hypothetical protein
MKLGGVIYLHDISQTRLDQSTTRKNFDLFRKLCGEKAYKSVILGTTKWAEVLPEVGKRREEELKSRYWNEMIAAGSVVQRFEGTSDSAWKIVNIIFDNVKETGHLQIQRELVERSLCLSQTEAGKTLRYTLEQLLEMQKQKAEELEAQAAADDDSYAYIRVELEENRNEIRKTLKQVKDLQIPLPRRIAAVFHIIVGQFYNCIILANFISVSNSIFKSWSMATHCSFSELSVFNLMELLLFTVLEAYHILFI